MTQLGPDFSDAELAAIAVGLGHDVALELLALLEAEQRGIGGRLEPEARLAKTASAELWLYRRGRSLQRTVTKCRSVAAKLRIEHEGG